MTAKKKIAIFGGGLNPLANHQLKCIEDVSKAMDSVIIFPSGPNRTDGIKRNIDFIPSRHRATLITLAYLALPEPVFDKVTLDLSDLERETFTPAYQLNDMFCSKYFGHDSESIEFWHVIGSDWFTRDKDGQPKIFTWKHGQEIWRDLNFLILNRPGYSIDPADLPPHHRLLPLTIPGSSSSIRKMIPELQPIDHLVPATVARYIESFRLYSGQQVPAMITSKLDSPRILLEYDLEKPEACRLADAAYKQLGKAIVNDSFEDYNLIVGIGGDGFLLGLVNTYWQRRVPFFGINAGRRGFLANNVAAGQITPEFFTKEFDLYESPLLSVDVTNRYGDSSSGILALNDAWMERARNQAAWFRLTVNGECLAERLPGDSMLVTTPTGSTAYWRNMGGPTFNVGSRQLGISASSPDLDYNFRPIIISDDSIIKIESVGDPAKRPTRVCADSFMIPDAVSMTVRLSPIAHCQILSLPGQRENKIRRLQVPAKPSA